ncbi:MAG: S8 family serine peptidase, partial [Kiritimatiellae bacterium]|nr:S8 family serine peptidase [Kiritimatiellia bacterium]
GILVLAAAMAVGAWWFATRRPRVVFAVPPPPAPAPVGVPKDRQVLLANRTLWVGERKRAFPARFAQTQKPTARGTLPYAVVCEAPVTGAVRERAEGLGVRVVRFLPSNALLVEADAAGLRKLEGDALFAAAFEITPVDKIQRALAERIAAGEETPEVTVLALSQADRNALRKDVEAAGGELLQGRLLGPCSLKARVSADFVLELLGRGEVTWVEGCARPKLLNDVAATPAAMNATPVWAGVGGVPGFTGAGQIVSTSDSGVDTGYPATMHADLRENVVWMKKSLDSNYGHDANGHGTHTAGSIVGTGAASDGQIKGIAHGAKLQAWFCLGDDGGLWTPQEYDDLFRPAAHDGRVASIHSASWGDNRTPGVYDAECENCDEWLWRHPDFLFVVAAGNDGQDAFVNTPATAKNCLTVGAVENARTAAPGYTNGWPAANPARIAGYSSRGPCKDGRIKPDLVAPGSGIVSTRAASGTYEFGTYEPNDRYAYNCGTSMATPLVAGAAAVVRQWLEEVAGFGDPAKPPTAAAMKAVLMGGATDVFSEPGTNVATPAPNNREGWGRVNLGETLAPSNRAVKVYDRVPFIDGGESAYLVTTTNAAPLDVQLAWIDYPGSASAKASAPHLVNDLDLEVTAVTDGEEIRWFGNGGAGRDALNPAECVRIANAPATTYRIVVRGRKVAYDHAQGGAAALYVRGAFDAAAVAGDGKTLTVATDFTAGAAASNRTAAASLDWGAHAVPANAAMRLSCNAYAYETNFCGTP